MCNWKGEQDDGDQKIKRAKKRKQQKTDDGDELIIGYRYLQKKKI